MPRRRELAARLAGAVRRARGDDRIDEEVREHLRLLGEEYERRGFPPADARRAARLAFGNPAALREAYRDQRSLPSVDSFVQDVRYAFRLLRRSPGFTLGAVLTLAIGIGVSTTIFTAVNAFMFRPPPGRHGHRLLRMPRWGAPRARA